MSKARDIANILSANTAIATDAEVSSAVSTAVSTHATAANGHVGRGPTDNRPVSPNVGDLYFDTNLLSLISYKSTGWEKVSQDPAPQIASISPLTAIAPGTTITITGSNYKSGLTVQFIGTNLSVYNSPVATFVNGITATATTPILPVAYEPYDVKLINSDGQFAILENVLDAGGTPVWNTASGTLATITEQNALSVSVNAVDPDGTSIIYSSSNLPAWISLNSSSGSLTGTAPDISSTTTYSFDVSASDGVNTSSRSFSVVVNAITAPSTVEALVVAGGAAGTYGNYCGYGGGGGEVIYNSNFSVTAGSSYSITIGNGGTQSTSTQSAGQDSIFSSIRANGGGDSPYNGTGTLINTIVPYYSSGNGYQHYAGVGGSTASEFGGGGGGAGGNAPTGSTAVGGIGVQSSITGTATYYGGGGGGGLGTSYSQSFGAGGQGGGGYGASNSGPAAAGSPNTGGGGGGGTAFRGTSSGANGAGGSGVVIIAYPNTFPALPSIGAGLTYDQPTRTGYRVYRFTAGSGSITF
jgi:hypothetical protein